MSTSILTWSLLAILTLLTPILPGEAAEEKTPVPATAPPPPAAIPVTEVATRAAEVLNLLPTLTAQMTPSSQLRAIVSQLPEMSENIEKGLAGIGQFLRGQPSLAMIAAQEQTWRARQLQTAAWLTLLTQRATQLQATLDQLAGLQATWRRTGDTAQAANAPEAIFHQIQAVLTAIQSTETPFQAQRAIVLDLQSRVAQEVARCGTALGFFAEAERMAMGGFLTRDSPPIWSAEQWRQARATFSARIVDVSVARREILVQYIQDSSKGFPLHVAAIVILMMLMCAARRRVRRWTAAGERVSPAMEVFDRPYAAALMLPLLYVSAPTSGVPSTVRQGFMVLGLVPVLRLTWSAVDRRVVPGLSIVALLFTLDTVRQSYAGTPGFEQAILALEMIAGIMSLAYALAHGELRRPAGTAPPERLQALQKGAILILAIFCVALLADIFGFLRLARLLASGVIAGGALALMLYAGFRVLNGLTALALHVWPMRLLQSVRRHQDLLNRRISLVLRCGVIGAWAVRMLDYVGLFQPTISFGTAILEARLQRGSMSLSLGDVLDFVLTVWVAYLLSAFIRFILQEDVYPRINLQRGITYAVSSLLNYIIVAVGFVLGLGALGIDLGKLTILAGAFGVGIGFGLQSVVNNFVSGLILLFERPIHVGDAVEVGAVSGEVRRIGIRASTVRTWQGAEIIVPNAQLVTEQLTNWTLSDRLRRIDLPVGVNYGAPPRKVMEMLETVARAHPGVLQNPAPQAYFTGFGDSSINFELRAWTGDFGRWYQIRSELAVAVYDAGYAAGMSFPFPQREVRLLRDAPADPEPAGSGKSDQSEKEEM